jgi:tetratricopeptide (TPR) repeat protein
MNSSGEQRESERVYGSISYADANSPYRVQPPKPEQPPPTKIVTPIRIAILLMSLLAVFIYEWRHGAFIPARDIRQTALVEVAPLQIDDTTTPLVGPEGLGADGYPKQYVDPVVLRAMLARKRYGDLTKYFEQFQDAFEADFKHEGWVAMAAGAFNTAEPGIMADLDAWVAASPSSFAPYLARGSHWEAVGFARRGSKYAAETSSGDIKAMRQAFVSADDDLRRATSIRPKLVAATPYQLSMTAAAGSRASMDALMDEALDICPNCFGIRATYISLSAPKWGGSLALMDSLARDAPVAKNSRLRFLSGYSELENMAVANSHADWKGALAAVERACALGDFAPFLAARSGARDRTDDLPGAKADIDHAIALSPKTSDYLASRAYLDIRSKDYEAAARDLLDALRINPTDEHARGQYESVVQGVNYLIQQDHAAGNEKEALRIADLGAELAPSNLSIQQERSWILSGAEKGPAAGASAAAAANASGTVPDDIDQVRQMDYALSREDKYTDILPLWDAYIAKHPNDGRAYLERGGTHLHLGQNDLAGQDALKACDLGVNEGCMRAHQLGL